MRTKIKITYFKDNSISELGTAQNGVYRFFPEGKIV